jgi:phosphatidylglycerol:prolipoprotein diacylglycerol transferase
MIPYFTVHVWGLFVALGIICGTVLAARRASSKEIKRSIVVDLIFWATFASVIGAKVVFILFNGKSGGSGFSSMGAVLAGATVVFVIAKIKKISIVCLLDILGPPALLAEGIGRIGCFILHEHLGKTTNFVLGTNVFGEVRHDLGLYFLLVGFAGLLFVLVLEKIWKKHATGAIGAVSLFWYFSWRFALEFLLEGSGPFAVAKIYGLTFMQIFSVVMIGFIVFYFLPRELRKVRVSGIHSGC